MTNGEKLKEVFPNAEIDYGLRGVVAVTFIHKTIFDLDWWDAEYKEPPTRKCFGCKYSKDNHNAGTEECHLCMWKNQYTPTTKNDLGVDCVSRKEVFETIDDCNSDGLKGIFCSYDDGERFKEYIKNLPPVTLQEPKTGHWIEMHDDWGNGIVTDRRYKCSVCHGKHIDPETGEWHEVFDYKYPFCPNCGAKMEEVEE